MSHMDAGASWPVWEHFVARHGVDDVIDGLVTRVLPFAVLVDVAEGVPGLLREMTPGPELGSRVSVRIVAVDAEKRRVALAPA